MPLEPVGKRFAHLFRQCMDSGLGRPGGEKWTAEALEKKSGASKRTLYTWLRGELNEPPKDSTFIPVEKVFCEEPTNRDLVNALVTAREEWKTAAWATDNTGITVAERGGGFVGYTEWERLNQSLFRPLERGSGDLKVIERFLDHDDKGEIVRDEFVRSRFHAALDTHRFVLLVGRAGSGKTMTALDLARSRISGSRVFVVTDWQAVEEDSFAAGALARADRPTIIVLDDLHHDYNKAERLLNRTLYGTRGKPLTFVLAARVDYKDELDDWIDTAELLAHANANGALIRLEPRDALFRTVLERVRPDLRLASDVQFKRLLAISARDLMLFRQTVDSVLSLDDLSQLSVDNISKRFLRRYFGAAPIHARKLLRLAALGQFEMSAPINWFERPLEPRYPDAVAALVVERGRPLTYQFVHGSLAELTFSALCWAHGLEQPEQFAAREIIDVLEKFLSEDERLEMLVEFLRGRLRLIDDSSVKQSLLADPKLIMWVTAKGASLRALSISAFLTTEVSCGALYARTLSDRLRSTWSENNTSELRDSLPMLGSALGAMKRIDPDRLQNVQEEWHATIVVERFDEAGGTLSDWVGILRNSSETFARSLMGALTDDFTAKLIDRSVQEGAVRTLPALAKILEYSSETFAASLIGALTDDLVATLIDRTIKEGASIRTINLSLRDLGKRKIPGGGTQLQALEARIGAEGMLRLVDEAEGTLPELLKILAHSSETFAASLIGVLTDNLAAKLINRTFWEGASIGTIALSLRDLGKRKMPGGGTQLQALEARIGAEGMLRLVDEAEGTLPELAQILRYSSETFAASLIGALTDDRVAKLIDRTIQEGASIGTIDLSLRDLAKRNMPGGGTELEALEVRIGAAEMLRLVDKADGTLPELVRILQHSSETFAALLIGALTDDLVATLIDRTIKEGASIGTIGLSLRDLGKRKMPGGGTQLEALNKHIDATAWWRLIAGCADCLHLTYLLSAFPLNKRNEILSHSLSPNVDSWSLIVSRSSLFGVAQLVINMWKSAPTQVIGKIENAIEATLDKVSSQSTWFEIRSALTLVTNAEPIGVLNDLRSAVFRRLDDVELVSLDDASEAIDLIGLLWAHQIGRRADLSKMILDLLPPEEKWKKNRKLFSSLRVLLQICCHSEVSYPTAQRVAAAAVDLASGVDLDKCSSLSLFLFVWNLYALKMEKWSEPEFVGSEILPDSVWRDLVAIAANRIEKKRGTRRERLNHLELVGIISFLVPSHEVEIRSALSKSISDTARLLNEAKNQTFIPAYFAMKGLGLAKDNSSEVIFTQSIRRLLIAKTKSYSWRGKAINALLSDLEALN